MLEKEIFFLVKDKLKSVEEKLAKDAGAHENPTTATITEHINNSGGKRLRPLLVLLCAALCGYKGDDDVYYGAIMEFIHEATLLHDDVIDESDLRRGKASANALYGNKLPVLAGDYLYSNSLLMLIEKGNFEILRVVIEVVTLVTDGQIVETKNIIDSRASESDYFDIIRKKTAALIAACCRIGGIIGGADESDKDSLEDVGYKLGLAFQLVDDALDYVAKSKKLGKKIGDDLKDGNYTLPIIHTISKASEAQKEKIDLILQSGSISGENFDYVLKLIKQYKSVDYTMDYAKKYVAEAKEKLLLFPPSKYRDALITAASFIVKRKH